MTRTFTQYVDPSVTKAKYKEELNSFLANKEINRKRGVFLIDAEFPNIWISFAAPQLKPSPIAFAVQINFTNYDAEPPSVTFVNPFSFRPLRPTEVGVGFPRKIVNPDGTPGLQPLLQAENNDVLPFICLRGFREYHNHPAHTGDFWLLYRNKGEGRLGYIVDKLYEYGITGMVSFRFNFNAVVEPPAIMLAFDSDIIPE